MKKGGRHELAKDWADADAMGSTKRRKVPTNHMTDRPKARSSSGRHKVPTGVGTTRKRMK